MRINEIDPIDAERFIGLREKQLDVKPEEIAYLYAHMDDPLSLKTCLLQMKYIHGGVFAPFLLSEQTRRLIAERSHEFLCLAEGTLELNTSNHSYGEFFPTYSNFLISQKKYFRTTGDANYRSLLVGALAANSVRAYEHTTRSVIPNSNPYVIDIKGVSTAIPSIFSIADGSRMPFAKNSMHSVQTNLLFRFLEPEVRYEFYDEAFRVLKPGGSVILIEDVPGVEYGTVHANDLAQIVRRDLLNSGFSKVRSYFPTSLGLARDITSVAYPEPRRTVVRTYQYEKSDNAVAIEAIKD